MDPPHHNPRLPSHYPSPAAKLSFPAYRTQLVRDQLQASRFLTCSSPASHCPLPSRPVLDTLPASRPSSVMLLGSESYVTSWILAGGSPQLPASPALQGVVCPTILPAALRPSWSIQRGRVVGGGRRRKERVGLRLWGRGGNESIQWMPLRADWEPPGCRQGRGQAGREALRRGPDWGSR